jgi:diguanylate cyclase (GGDEF)-like protein
MIQFIIKVTALDMSLAVETYYTDKVVSLERSIDSMRGEGELLRKNLRTDSLTKLCSRDFSIQVLKEALESSQQNGRPLSVVMADLDHFKSVNDHYGHLVGDQVLGTVAARISCDARERDTMGRYGGEEFLIILEHTGLADAMQVAERIRKEVGANPVHVDDITVPVTISLGVAEACDNDDAKSLTARADRALYAAKAAGRNRVEFAAAKRHSGEREKLKRTGRQQEEKAPDQELRVPTV